MEEIKMDRIEDAIADFKEGKFVIVVDDEDRENEGDLIIAAEKITPEKVNFMLKHARGEYIRDRTFQAVELRLCRREITATFQIGIKFKASANGQIKIFYVSLQAIKGTF